MSEDFFVILSVLPLFDNLYILINNYVFHKLTKNLYTHPRARKKKINKGRGAP